MAQLINVPNQGVVSFPDDMSEGDIVAAIKKNSLGYKQETPKPAESSLTTKAISAIGHYIADKANTGFGALRGAAGIGATIAQPFQYAYDQATGKTDKGLSSLITGKAPLSTNAEMRANLDTSLQSLGADPSLDSYKGGKLASEVALTYPLGGALGAGAKALGLNRLGTSIASAGGDIASKAAPAFSMQGLSNAGLHIAGSGINAGASSLAATGSPEDALKGTGIGMAIPVVGKVAGELGGGLYNLANKAIAPLTQDGRQKILVDNITQMLGDKAPQIANNLINAKGMTAGFNPTAGQAGNSAELATFERMFKNRNAGLFEDAVNGQRTALAAGANSLGGSDLERAALDTARNDAANVIYTKARTSDAMRRELINNSNLANKQLLVGSTTDLVSPELRALSTRPAFKNAINDAKTLMANDGVIADPLTSVNGLHYIKLALDDSISKGMNPTSKLGNNELSALLGTKDSLLKEIDKISPTYKQGKDLYASMSPPINQMDLGNAIRDKFIPAQYRDMPTPLQLNRANLSKITQDTGDTLAKQVTGFKGATLDNTLSSQQQDTLKGLLHDNNLVDNGEKLGLGTGSPTYQHLAYNAKGENGGLLNSLLSVTHTGKALGAVKDMAYSMSGSVRKLDSQMADMLLNPNTTGQMIQARLSQLSQPKRDSIIKLIGQQSGKVAPVGLLEMSQ